jgi:peptide/nickel transport system substrate-binding protein
MNRREFLAAASFSLAMPAIARGQASQVLTVIPQADLAVLDPVWTTTYQTRDHGFLVFDTLFGVDRDYKAQPQMVEGAVVEEDGRRWTLSLRPGLTFHDGAKVLARDCVASVKRWGARDSYGQALIAATDEISAVDDSRIVFRMKQAALPAAPRCARQDAAEHLRHHAGAPRLDRSLPAGYRNGRQRTLPLQGGRARARCPRRL